MSGWINTVIILKDACIIAPVFFLLLLLEWSWFPVLRWFLLYNKVNQLQVYIYPPFWVLLFSYDSFLSSFREGGTEISQVGHVPVPITPPQSAVFALVDEPALKH